MRIRRELGRARHMRRLTRNLFAIKLTISIRHCFSNLLIMCLLVCVENLSSILPFCGGVFGRHIKKLKCVKFYQLYYSFMLEQFYDINSVCVYLFWQLLPLLPLGSNQNQQNFIHWSRGCLCLMMSSLPL